MKSELVQAAIMELEEALDANADVLNTNGRRTLTVKLTSTKIKGGHRLAGSCLANGRKYFSFGTIVYKNLEDLT